MRPLETDLAEALRLADIADGISASYFRKKGLVASVKRDGSIVTAADRQVELALRRHLSKMRPSDGIIGEEFGETVPADRRWIIDPIDGSKAYAGGSPAFATLIALETQSVLDVGVVSAPALRRRWWAVRGKGAFADGLPMRVSSTPTLADARVALADCEGWAHCGQLKARERVSQASRDGVAYNNFLSHMGVAEGLIDAALEPSAAVWDLAAVQILVVESGGSFTDLAGNITPRGGSAVATNGAIHKEVIGILRCQ
jgi:histidinol-phosphatase